MMRGHVLEYKGFHTKISFDTGSFVLYGKIEGINDHVDFQTHDPDCVVEEFHKAVDDYLLFCEEVGKTPEKEYKGSFNVRIAPDLHRRLAAYADKINESLNHTVEEAIVYYLEPEQIEKREKRVAG